MSNNMIFIRVTDENGCTVNNPSSEPSSYRRLVSPPPGKDRAAANNFFINSKASSLQPFSQQTNRSPI